MFNVPTWPDTTHPAPLDRRQLAFSAAAATDRRQSQPGANSERRSGSNRALTTGRLSNPTLPSELQGRA